MGDKWNTLTFATNGACPPEARWPGTWPTGRAYATARPTCGSSAGGRAAGRRCCKSAARTRIPFPASTTPPRRVTSRRGMSPWSRPCGSWGRSWASGPRRSSFTTRATSTSAMRRNSTAACSGTTSTPSYTSTGSRWTSTPSPSRKRRWSGWTGSTWRTPAGTRPCAGTSSACPPPDWLCWRGPCGERGTRRGEAFPGISVFGQPTVERSQGSWIFGTSLMSRLV